MIFLCHISSICTIFDAKSMPPPWLSSVCVIFINTWPVTCLWPGKAYVPGRLNWPFSYALPFQPRCLSVLLLPVCVVACSLSVMKHTCGSLSVFCSKLVFMACCALKSSWLCTEITLCFLRRPFWALPLHVLYPSGNPRTDDLLVALSFELSETPKLFVG